MTYELVKYRYGRVKTYTAFCLTPAIEPKVVKMAGREWTVSNKGLSSSASKHFQRRSEAEAYLDMGKHKIIAPDWSLLPNTVQFA